MSVFQARVTFLLLVGDSRLPLAVRYHHGSWSQERRSFNVEPCAERHKGLGVGDLPSENDSLVGWELTASLCSRPGEVLVKVEGLFGSRSRKVLGKWHDHHGWPGHLAKYFNGSYSLSPIFELRPIVSPHR